MVTEEFLLTELGPLDELTQARILALGATAAEVIEAREWLEGEEEVESTLGHPSSERVRRLVVLLRDFWEGEEDEERPAPSP